MSDLQRCEAEIARILAYLLAGGDEEIGAYVGLQDWRDEARLIREEQTA